MTDFEKLLKTNIKSVLGREVSDTEYQNFISNNGLSHSESGLTEWTFEEIENAIYDWRDNEMHQCEQCGEWHLEDDMEKTDEGWFCDDGCIEAYGYDTGFEFSRAAMAWVKA